MTARGGLRSAGLFFPQPESSRSFRASAMTLGLTIRLAILASSACTVPNPDYRPRCKTMHSDCDSNACLPNRECVEAAKVAYVDPLGTSGPACTQEMPCNSFQAALETKRPYIKITGTIDAHVNFVNQNVTVLADRGAMLTSATPGNLLVVTGRSKVSIVDLEIAGATGGDDPIGTGVLLPAGNAATLDLERVTIRKSQGSGLYSYGGVVNVTASTISDNELGGLAAEGGVMNVTQSTIRDNGAGGIDLIMPKGFQITNNFIYLNGNDLSKTGGIHLVAKANPSVINTLEFNTIVRNRAGRQGSTLSGGVVCDVPGHVAANNLIFENSGGPASDPQVGGTCGYGNSLLSAPANSGFVSADDLHLTAQTPSVIIDKADCGGIKVDIDGDARPAGLACDLGADEFGARRLSN